MKSVVKDYRIGKEYVEIKHKPDLPIKGRANVYIYNARTGALEVEAHTPNIIYPEVYAWLKSYQWDKFCTGAYNKSISYGGYWEMDKIFLSSSSKPENERVNLLTYNESNTSDGNPGIQIGWADKSIYSGSDTMRGTPNTAESYATNNRIHWVFDWPTHAANGTFQTIIWGNNFLPYIDIVLNERIGISTRGVTGFDLATDGTFLYTLTYDGIFYKISTSGDVLSSIDTGIRSYDQSCIGITFMDPYFYAIEYNGTLHKISTSGVVLNTYNTGINTKLTTGFGLASDGTYLYALSYEKVLYKISADGTVISSHNINGSMEQGYDGGFSLTYVSPYLYVLSPCYYLYKISLTGEIIGAVGGPIYADYNTVGITSIGEYLYVLNYDGNFYKWHIADHYFARTRLAAPVTKTNQQTMKIQYDFIYEE